jgi:hypothetical protein
VARMHTRVVVYDLTTGKSREFPLGKISVHAAEERWPGVAIDHVPVRREHGVDHHDCVKRTVIAKGERLVMLIHR